MNRSLDGQYKIKCSLMIKAATPTDRVPSLRAFLDAGPGPWTLQPGSPGPQLLE